MHKLIIDTIQRKSVWTIKRFKSERDMEDNKIYHPRESLEMFKAPQFSVIKGGVMGALANLKVIREKLGERASLAAFQDLFGSVEHAFGGNVLLNEGINTLWTLLCSSSGTKFDNTNAYLGVGDSSAAEDPTQTGLQASTNKQYIGMDVSFPTYGTSQKATWEATFTSAYANYAWNEFTVANGNSDAAMNLNRKVSSQGTKASGQSWQLSFAISLS